MQTPTIRISENSKAILLDLAKKQNLSMTRTLDWVLYEYQRLVFFKELNEGYAKLRADPEAWKQELEEREAWDCTLMDGLKDEPPWEE